MKFKCFVIFLATLLLLALLCSCERADVNSDENARPTEKPTDAPEQTEAVCLHEYSDWQTETEPTCTSDGLEARICLLCEERLERAIPMREHTLKKTLYAPDCTSEGYIECVCECGYSYRTDVVAPKGHTLSENITLPTCNEQGYIEYSCSDCDYSFRTDTLAPKGHTLSENITLPTCDEQGYTEYDCSDCDYSYIGSFVAAKGHSFTHERSLPTILTPGYTTHTCECSFSYTDEYIFYSDILENAYCSNTEVLAKGIDVSRWNHEQDENGNYLPLDWNAIKAQGVDFVIIKAGSTKSGIEPTFDMDYEGARAAGLEIGVYYYTYATTIEGIRADAEALMTYLDGKKFEYPIYLDLEEPTLEALGKNYLSDMCEAFVVTLQENGYYAALYSNHNWLTYILDSAKIFSLYDVWYARYPLSEKPTWNEEKYGKQLGMWQYSESGTLEGFSCPFDMNYAYKDYSEIMKKWGFNGF